MSSLGESFRFEVSSKRGQGALRLPRRFAPRNDVLRIGEGGLEGAGRGGRPRQNEQNEPNLARPEGKCAQQTQSRSPGQDVGWGRPTPDQVGGRLYEEANRAKRTQFRPGAGG
jgi:hypothetical protein